MILAAAKVFKERGQNYHQSLLVQTQDVSEICVYMTYIQLSLYGVAATVTCGNTLALENKFTFFTPMYYIGEWEEKQCISKQLKILKQLLDIKPNEQEIDIDLEN